MDYYNYGQPYAGNPYYQPAMQMQNLQNQIANAQTQVQSMQDNRFVYIQGKEAAKAYPVAPEKTVLFLDDQNPYAYRKTTDREGKTVEFKVFRLEEEVEIEEMPVNANYATKDDLSNLQNSIDELKALLLQSKKPYSPKPRRDNNA